MFSNPRKVRDILLIVATITLMMIAVIGWKDLYSDFLELSGPEIVMLETPRGVGVTPVTFRIEVKDPQSGLSAVSVLLRQRDDVREIRDLHLQGEKQQILNLEFSPEQGRFAEGPASLEVRAKNASWWGTWSTWVIPVKIDYHRPRLEVVAARPIIRAGSGSIVIYRARDDDLSFSGVKIGNYTFPGYPARGIDEALKDPDLFVALIAVHPTRVDRGAPVRLFAEDGVGNVSAQNLESKVEMAVSTPVNVHLSPDYMQEMAKVSEQILPQVNDRLALPVPTSFKGQRGDDARLVEQLKFFIGPATDFTENRLGGYLKGPRFESLWDGAFAAPLGKLRLQYGELATLLYGGKALGTQLLLMNEYELSRDNHEVHAGADGVVAFVDIVGIYGRVVALDHGLGLTSFYRGLESTSVQRGDKVEKGQALGVASWGGFTGNYRAEYQLRIHGVPVNPGEWSNRTWYAVEIEAPINASKRALGLPVYRALP